jgi:hypothetical protein
MYMRIGLALFVLGLRGLDLDPHDRDRDRFRNGRVVDPRIEGRLR